MAALIENVKRLKGTLGTTPSKPASAQSRAFFLRNLLGTQASCHFKGSFFVTFSRIDSCQISVKTAETATSLRIGAVFCEHSRAAADQAKKLKIRTLEKNPNRSCCRKASFFTAQLSQRPPKNPRTFVSTSNTLHFLNTVNMNSFSTPAQAPNLLKQANHACTAASTIIVVDIVSAVRPPGLEGHNRREHSFFV